MTEREELITDAAIALLAELGMRGLTHRAVDARAGIALGSTSAYFRTRKALIEAVVRRLADLDQRDLAAGQLPVGAQPPVDLPALTPADLDQIAVGIARLLDRWLTAGRTRMLARYACLLEATHHPELRDILGHGVASRVQSRALLARAGAPDAERRGDYLVAAIDGLLFDRLMGAGALTAPPPGTKAGVADLTNAVRLLLHGMSTPWPATPQDDEVEVQVSA